MGSIHEQEASMCMTNQLSGVAGTTWCDVTGVAYILVRRLVLWAKAHSGDLAQIHYLYIFIYIMIYDLLFIYIYNKSSVCKGGRIT